MWNAISTGSQKSGAYVMYDKKITLKIIDKKLPEKVSYSLILPSVLQFCA